MAVNQGLSSLLRDTHRYMKTTISVFEEEDGGFAPQEELFTVAGHVAHAAQTVDWFMKGAFGDGFPMEFEALDAEVRGVDSLADAVSWLDRAFENAEKKVLGATEAELREPLPDGPIMGGEPRLGVVSGIVDHTAHHRGSLAVYARLIGKVPPMPYA